MQAEKRIFIVNEENARLDVYLRDKLQSSRVKVQSLLDGGNILLNDKKSKASYQVQKGDKIEVIMPPVAPLDVVAEDIPLDIIYEDKYMLIINKARGMVVHPAPGNLSGTLVNALLYHCHDLSGINGIMRPGIVHRLDKDTSGVMVVAKTDEAHHVLAEAIKNKEAQRIYLALVHGNIREDKGMIESMLGRSPRDRKKMAVLTSGGKYALTYFKVLERFKKYTYVECILGTGRTHQIRVHMAHIGHPLLGDTKYSRRENAFSIGGQALHSYKLSLQHPISKKKMEFCACLPRDMEDILASLRGVSTS